MAFQGNRALSATELRRAAGPLLTRLRRGKENRAALTDAAWEMEQLYRNRGFPRARVRWRRADPPAAGVLFEIEEGPLVELGKIRVRGARALDPKALRALLQPPRGTFLTLELGGELYSQASLRAWAGAIEQAYRQAGYLEVEVGVPAATPAGEGQAMDVEIEVKEGRLFQVEEIALAGASRILKPETRRKLAALAGSPAFPAVEQDARMVALTDLREQGRIDFRVEAQARIDRERARVSATLTIAPGVVATIKEIRILGLVAVSEEAVRARLTCTAGARLDRGLIEESISRLYRSGLFRRIYTDLVPLAEPGRVRLDITCREAETKDFRLLVGAGSYEGPRVGAGFSDRNIFGLARTLRVDARASPRLQRLRSTLLDNYFLGRDQVAALSGEAWMHDRPHFRESHLSGALSLTRPLSRHTRVQGSWSYRREKVEDAEGELDREEGTSRVGSLTLRLAYDSRDHVLTPTRGLLAEGEVEAANPSFLGDTSFTRFRLGLTSLFPLGTKYVLGLHASGTVIFPYGDTEVLPLTERVFGGGETSVRSFGQDDLGPVDAMETPRGGQFGTLFSVELRRHLAGDLEGALFWDAGNIGLDADDLNLDGIDHAFGVGLRYLLPIGPIRLDAGWNPWPSSHQDDYAIHFSVGYSF